MDHSESQLLIRPRNHCSSCHATILRKTLSRNVPVAQSAQTYGEERLSHSLKILFVLGTRPEAIKLAPVLRRFREVPSEFETRVVVTGQHRALLDQVLEAFAIVPDYDLD